VRRERTRRHQGHFLEVDAAAISFPIAKTRGFRSWGTADLAGLVGGRRGTGWNLRDCPHIDRSLGGRNLGGLDVRHGKEFCQNRWPTTTETPAKTKMSKSSELADDRADARGAIAFRGPDAAKFLQGQLSADIAKLVPGTRTPAGFHNPQGRVVALLDLVQVSDGEFIATLPRELVATVSDRLKKYVLRAKLRIEDAGNATAVDSLAALRAGAPEVYLATSEAFVAQMLNLDLLGAIAFDKGCYTGQEVIARAHYRGRVKRRMQRWLNSSGARLAPGDTARGPDGRSLSVVRTALADVGQEILAVGTFAEAGEPSTEATSAEAVPTDAVTVSGPLPLPYALPA
jgi:tRNA-modifying protein YgfZ